MNGDIHTQSIACGLRPVEVTLPDSALPSSLDQITYEWMDNFWRSLTDEQKDFVRAYHYFDPRTYDPQKTETYDRQNAYYMNPYFPHHTNSGAWSQTQVPGDAFKGLPVAEMARPRDFSEEKIASLDGQTYRVEVLRPPGFFEIGIPGVGTGSALKSVPIRGWYIKGSSNGSLPPKRKLVIVYNGRGEELLQQLGPDPLLQGGSCVRRDIIAELVLAGFDVWTPDLRAHGVSEGLCSFDNQSMAMDVFGALSQFESGIGLTVLGPDGPTTEPLLPCAAADTPILLYGQSQGTMVMLKAMTLHLLARELSLPRLQTGRFAKFFRPQIEELVQAYAHLGGARLAEVLNVLKIDDIGSWDADTLDEETATAVMALMRGYYAQFKIKGVISIDGHEGQRYTSWVEFALAPLNRCEFVFDDVNYPQQVNGVSLSRPPGASIPPGLGAAWDAISFELQARWPAHLQIHATADEASPLINVIEGYNRERGLKKLLILPGSHDILCKGNDGGPQAVQVATETIVEFTKAAFDYSGGLNDHSWTTLAAEVCNSVAITSLLHPRAQRRPHWPPWPPSGLRRPGEEHFSFRALERSVWDRLARLGQRLGGILSGARSRSRAPS